VNGCGKWCDEKERLAMMDDPTVMFQVVVNHEEQYSIWPVGRENALGWTSEGTSGTKEECLAHINEIWLDMRPLSLRRRMAESA
jgi:MbtH protein